MYSGHVVGTWGIWGQERAQKTWCSCVLDAFSKQKRDRVMWWCLETLHSKNQPTKSIRFASWIAIARWKGAKKKKKRKTRAPNHHFFKNAVSSSRCKFYKNDSPRKKQQWLMVALNFLVVDNLKLLWLICLHRIPRNLIKGTHGQWAPSNDH